MENLKESSYSVRQLTEMYKTTKQTIHVKLQHPEIQNYVTRQNNKVYLNMTGLNIFNVIMANSKVNTLQSNQKDDNFNTNISELDSKKEPDFQNLYIEKLCQDNDRLRQENDKLKEQVDYLIKGIFDFQKTLPEPQQKPRWKFFGWNKN
jgi:uncharacterized coiled-coil protein SlyX